MVVIKITMFFFLFFNTTTDKKFVKDYYESGAVKSVGWITKSQRDDYWIFYYENGAIMQRGSYKNGKKTGYWSFYNSDRSLQCKGHYENDKRVKWWIIKKENRVTEKVQYVNDVKEGYSMLYKNGIPFKAKLYKDDKLAGTWTSVSSFKKDNPQVRL